MDACYCDKNLCLGNSVPYRQMRENTFKVHGKMFVRNVSQSVSKDQLLENLTPHANLTSAFIVKHKNKGPNYGFVSIPTEEDGKKFIDLNNQDLYISGKKIIFEPLHKRFTKPIDKVFFRSKLPCGDFDLKPVNTHEPSIHILCDDIMINILKYLPLRKIIFCEIICRRWRALIYFLFENTLQLNLSPYTMMTNYLNEKKGRKHMLSKLLLLTGETLKNLYISETIFSLNKNMFWMIAQLCPNLEYLDLTCYLPYYEDNRWPKRPSSAFFYMADDKRSKVHATNPYLTMRKVTEELGRQWIEASENERAPYKKLEREDRARYDAEWKAYKAGETPLLMKKTNTHNVSGVELAASAFLLYADKMHCKIRAANPHYGLSEEYRESRRLWNELSETDKAPFVKISEDKIVDRNKKIDGSYIEESDSECDEEESDNEGE